VLSRHVKPDCIVLVDQFVRLYELPNPLLEVFKHTDLHCMEEVGLREVAHDLGTISKDFESSVNVAQQEFSIGCLHVGINERSI
jgi:hypothetical protein